MTNEKGANGFSKNYWDKNYSEPEEMDGIVNANLHAKYIKHFFEVDYVDVSSVIDFGFGLGHIFEHVLKEFMPFKAHGIEPSDFAYQQVVSRKIKPAPSTKLKLEQKDLVTWAKEQSNVSDKWFDLGICTSVFQYLSDEEIEMVIPVMAKMTKYLYFSVPTNIELKRQVSDLEFHDEYAISRTRKKYYDFLSKHFTFIGSRILESKYHFNQENTFFTDLLFRF